MTDPAQPQRRLRRAAAGLLAVAQVVGLVWLVNLPVFHVRHIALSGLSHLSRSQVSVVAAVSPTDSVFRVDPATIERRLTRLAWVRTARVTPSLPDQVTITIEEWKPVAIYRSGTGGAPEFLNELGVVIAPAEVSAAPAPVATTAPFSVTGPAGPDPLQGSRPLDARLLNAMGAIRRVLPSFLDQGVAGYELDCQPALTLTTDRGVRILFGRVGTTEELLSLEEKLGSLRSIATDPAIRAGQVEYINLMNPLGPAVRPRITPSPSAAPSPSPSAGAVSTPLAGEPSPASPSPCR